MPPDSELLANLPPDDPLLKILESAKDDAKALQDIVKAANSIGLEDVIKAANSTGLEDVIKAANSTGLEDVIKAANSTGLDQILQSLPSYEAPSYEYSQRSPPFRRRRRNGQSSG
jgi:hypothetical protein